MESIAVSDPAEFERVETDGSRVEQLARSITVGTEQEHGAACALEREWKLKEDQAKKLTEEVVEDGRKAWKSALALQDKLVGAYSRARQLLKAKLGAYRDAETRRIAEVARQDKLAAAKRAEDEALSRAQKAQDAGRPEVAEQIISAPVKVPFVLAPRPIDKGGVVVVERWSAEVHDLDALIRWGAADLENRRQFLAAVGPALNEQARSFKAALNAEPAPIPGVRGIKKFT
jgi:hypothetical protein